MPEINEELTSGFWTKHRSSLWIVLPAIPVIVWLLLSLCYRGPYDGLAQVREGMAHAWISQLSEAAKAYELDFAACPPGDGTGSKGLAAALQKKGAKQMKYFEFSADMLDQGNVVNPVWGRDAEPPKNWIHYRCPGLRNPKTFDLWCADSKGKVDGINNWDP